jgi:hypothetical protein
MLKLMRNKYIRLALFVIIAGCKSAPPTENERKLRALFEKKLAVLSSLEDVNKPNFVELKPNGEAIFYPAYDFSAMFSDEKPRSWELLEDGGLLIRGTYRNYKGESQKENFVHLKTGGFQIWAEPRCVVPENLGKVWVFSEANRDFSGTRYLYFFTPVPEKVLAHCLTQSAEARKKRLLEVTKKFGAKYAELITDHKITIGMTKEMVIESYGEPKYVNRTVTGHGSSEQWVYEDLATQYLYFTGNKLTAFQD